MGTQQPTKPFIAGEEEMLIVGGVAMEEETVFSIDLSVGVVMQKI